MIETVSRRTDLRRVLFLCADNYHESRFCEELFNSYTRAESLNWQATSRAVHPDPAARNEGPMSRAAIALLRTLGAAPVNHLRLPLAVTHFDFQMSDVVIALDLAWLAALQDRWGRYAHRIEYWSLPRVGEPHSQATLLQLKRDIAAYVGALQQRPLPPVGGLAAGARYYAG